MHLIFSKKFLLSTLFLWISCIVAFAQTGSVRGFVYDKESGEPIIFTNVVLKGTSMGAATDVNGYYSITQIPPGDYTLTVSSLGYQTLEEAVSVKSGDVITKELYLEESSVELGAVEVSAERQEARTEVRTSVTKITPKEMKQIPTIGGEPDLAQVLQVQPGVIFTGDQGGQLYIRGGSPIQNKVLLDGMTIYNPFHSIGLFSVFDTDIIRNADIYTGGFNAEYGGRISSIMDITTRNGNNRRFSGKISASPFGANTILEGPLKKYDGEGGGSSSFLFSGKTSYLEQSSQLLYDYIDTAGLPFNYTDLYGKISLNSASGSKVNLFGFNYNDRVNYPSADFGWNSTGIGSNFILVPSGSPVLVSGNFAWSGYSIALEEEDQQPRESSISGFDLGLDFTYFMGNNELKYGLDVLGFQTDYVFFNAANRKIEQQQNTTEFAAFLKYRVNIKEKLILEPSFRAHYYATLSTFSPEPRLGMKYNVTPGFRLKYAGGLFSQNLISANSDRDVVNLFYGFLSGPDNLPDEFRGEEVTHNLQKANHNILGFELDLSRRMTLNVEGYLKNFTQLTNINRNKIFSDNAENADVPDLLKKDFIIEEGRAMGVDVVLKYDYKQLYLFAVYSLGKVTRKDEVMEYAPHFDRRHNVNLVASYRFGKGRLWEANARWNLGSGFPFTQTQGFYPNLNFDDGITTDYTTANGDLGIVYADLNGGRLPYYHRLDITVKRTFDLGKYTSLEANIGVTNVYNRENIFYFDRVKYERVNQLPIMPSAGLTFRF